jgi:hypothetical protein
MISNSRGRARGPRRKLGQRMQASLNFGLFRPKASDLQLSETEFGDARGTTVRCSGEHRVAVGDLLMQLTSPSASGSMITTARWLRRDGRVDLRGLQSVECDATHWAGAEFGST